MNQFTSQCVLVQCVVFVQTVWQENIPNYNHSKPPRNIHPRTYSYYLVLYDVTDFDIDVSMTLTFPKHVNKRSTYAFAKPTAFPTRCNCVHFILYTAIIVYQYFNREHLYEMFKLWEVWLDYFNWRVLKINLQYCYFKCRDNKWFMYDI